MNTAGELADYISNEYSKVESELTDYNNYSYVSSINQHLNNIEYAHEADAKKLVVSIVDNMEIFTRQKSSS